jgi:hypothetical protein
MRVQKVCKTTPTALSAPYKDQEQGQAPEPFAGGPGHDVPRPATNPAESTEPPATAASAPARIQPRSPHRHYQLPHLRIP